MGEEHREKNEKRGSYYVWRYNTCIRWFGFVCLYTNLYVQKTRARFDNYTLLKEHRSLRITLVFNKKWKKM